MAEVPYNPVPQVAATDRGISPIRQDAPAAAFGAGVADAVTGLGSTIQRGGAELYDRALAMQTLDQQAQATQATAATADQVSSLKADYLTKEGLNAVNDLVPFQQRISDAREAERAKLTSPLAQRYFDEQTRSMQNRVVEVAAGYAAGQHKKVILDASDARIDSAVNQALTEPFNDASFNDNLKVVETEAKFKAQSMGASSEATQEMVDVSTSNLRVAKITGMMKTDPFQAKKLFDQWSSTGVLPAQKSATEQVGKDVGIAAEPGEGGRQPFRGPGGAEYKPGSILVKPGTDLGDLSPGAKGMLNGILQAGIQPRITAGFASSGHVGHSQHYAGNAIDFNVAGWSEDQKAALVQAGINSGARGIGIYPSGNAIHMDTRESPTVWGPNPDGMYKGASLDSFSPKMQQVLQSMYQRGNRSGGLIRGLQAQQLEPRIQQSLITTGARQQASALNAGDLSWGEHAQDLNTIGEAIAGIESSNSWIGRHPPAPGETRDRMPRYALGRYGIMNENLGSFLKMAGLPDMSEDEFIANHAAQTQVFKAVFGSYMKEFNGNANLAAIKWFGGQGAVDKYLAGGAGGINDGHTSVPGYLQKFNQNLARGSSGKDFQEVAQTRAAQLLPGNTEFADQLQNQLELLHHRQNSIDAETASDTVNKVMDEMVQGRLDGHTPTSPDDLSPEAKAAFDELDGRKQMSIINAMSRLVKGDFAWDPAGANLKEYQQLMGMAQSPNRTTEQTQEFMAIEPWNLKMPISARQSIAGEQRRIAKNEEANPSIKQAMGILTASRVALPSPKDEPDDYNQFIGTIHDVMSSFAAANGRPMNPKEIETMGTVLTQKIAQEKAGWFGLWNSTSQTEMYKMPVPDEAQRAIINDWKAEHYGAEPNEEQIHAVFIAHEYQAVVGKVPPAPAPTAPISVPQSR